MAALSSQQSLQLYGTTAYTGWNDTEAAADAKAKGLTGNQSTSSGNTAQDAAQMLQDSITSLFKTVPSYESVNPFSFDEALATQASTAEYSPYYDQMLSDYTNTVNTQKSRSNEDLQNTLAQLQAGKEYYMGTERRLLDRTLDQTNNGYAGQGLFFSGARQKDINQIQTEYGAQTGEYNRQEQYNESQAQLANTRTQQDIATNLGQYTRDIGQEKQYAIQQGVLQRQSEAIQQYEAGRQSYYDAAGYGGGTSGTA